MLRKEIEHWETYKDVMDRGSVRTLHEIMGDVVKSYEEIEPEFKRMLADDPSDTIVEGILADLERVRAIMVEMEPHLS